MAMREHVGYFDIHLLATCSNLLTPQLFLMGLGEIGCAVETEVIFGHRARLTVTRLLAGITHRLLSVCASRAHRMVAGS